MLDFRIHTFLQLCHYKSYTKTAQALCVTQPTVTQHIQYLEQKYNARLFHYEGKRLELTPQGRFLQQAALTMQADNQRIAEGISAFAAAPPHLRFGSTLTIGQFVLPPLLNRFMEQHPQVEISMAVENTSTLLEKLNAGKIDFALIEGYFNKGDYDHALFFRDTFIGIAHPGHPLAHSSLTLEHLLGERVIIREEGSGTREIFHRVLAERNLSIASFQGVTEIGSMSVLKYLVEQGRGISFLYRSAAARELEAGTLIPLPLQDFHIQREYNFVTLKNSMFLQQYLDFLRFLQQEREQHSL